MNAAVSQMVITLGLMQVGKQIPFDNPQVLDYVRIGYVVSQVAVLGVLYFTSVKIRRRNDTTVLKYVEPKSAFDQSPGSLTTTTHRDYDLSKVSEGVRQVFLGVCIMGVMHLYFKYTQPLFLQGVMAVKGLYDNKVVKIHILGQDAQGDLKRPFKAGGLMGAVDPQNDEASIKKAEKKDKKGGKSD